MARRWQVIRVELIGGRGERCEPPPGRTFIVPPRATFAEFGHAIDLAFARWDLSHLRVFDLMDGTSIADEESIDEWRNNMGGPIPRMVSIEEPVKRHIKDVGVQFSYTFDLGDDWFHLCTLEGYDDPAAVYGADPSVPVAIWGWGMIPDQYGRRWNGDSGWDDEGDVEPQPVVVPPELDKYNRFPRPAPLVDVNVVRLAASADASASVRIAAIIDAVSGVQLEPALQQVAAVLLEVVRSLPPRQGEPLQSVLAALYSRALSRRWEGDALLAEALLATLQGRETKPPLRPIKLSVQDLIVAMTDSMGDGEHEGGYLNTSTGEAVHAMLTDSAYVGADAVVDVDGDEWVLVPNVDSHTGWRDMEAFIRTVDDDSLRERFERAIEGRGAYCRFRDVLHQDADEQTRARWYLEKEDRDWGRARAFLAEHGLRPT